MKYLIISFKSRNELYGFANAMKANSITLSIINSPKSIGSSCLLSIKTDYKHLNKIYSILRYYNPKSFLGIYLFQQGINGDQILKLF